METKLCRLCGKIGQDFLQIFNTDGLKNKIETCLPMVISPHSLLPDAICEKCTENINSFHQFIKICLQNTIILESQYNIQESCLKSKQKKDKGCMVDLTYMTSNKINQTDDFLDVISGKNDNLKVYSNILPGTLKYLDNAIPLSSVTSTHLVDYDIESDSQPESDNEGIVILGEKLQTLNKINRLVDSVIFNPKNLSKTRYSDNVESKLISEISQRKYLKRKNDFIEQSKPKICKWDSTNRRKNKIPKKLDITETVIEKSNLQSSGDCTLDKINDSEQKSDVPYSITENARTLQVNQDLMNMLAQKCLLCDSHYNEPASFVAHIFEAHGFDMTGVSMFGNNEWIAEKNKKKIPNLLKISDLKKSDIIENNQLNEDQSSQEQEILRFRCSDCPAAFTDNQDLLQHIQLAHLKLTTHVCGICSHECSSLSSLQEHLVTCCEQLQKKATKYICRICCFGDDSFRDLEKHVLVHDFLIDICKKQMKIFDPADYVDCLGNVSNFSCTECGSSDFGSFKEFSCHRRDKHHIFHCDLCNKFYGRNSHLWKHVNRLHKGHPSITCQVCFKTSASKYHLVQHFNKMHAKNTKPKNIDVNLNEGEQTQHFFNFQCSKPTFIKQEEKNTSENEDSTDYSDQEELMLQGCEIKQEIKEEPKEIDSSHDLYTNIITNYTPPQNEGDFKCPKCSKGFYKKMLLKKHRKNCRPKLQKDLLTRCKSCARVFKDRVSLTKHLVNYHSEYVCEICSQKAQSKCEIVAHIRFQHPNSNLVCKICNNILRCEEDLREHLRNHVDSYICQFCADPLPSKIKLKMHILSLHRKILSLSCGICLKLFETQHVLKDHVGIAHKDELTPLTSCPVCGKNYGSKWKTYDHLNKSHGRIFRACKTCLEVFDNDAQLQAHCDVTSHSQGGNVNGAMNFLKSSMLSLMGVTVKEEQNEDCSDIEEMEESNESNVESENEEEAASNVQFTLPQNTKICLLEKRLLGKPLAKPDLSNKPNTPKSANVFETKKEPVPAKREEESEHSNPLVNSSKRTVYVNSNDPSRCEICFKTWPAKKHLWQHYIRCHKAEAATVCGICLKMNESYAVLQEHLQQNHPTLLHGQGFGSKFICRICGRYHNASSKLRLHMVIHENFDWKLIENVTSHNKSNEKIDKPPTNGLKDCKKEPKMYDDNDINYDSLIEQVECSSQSAEGDSDDERSKMDKRDGSSSNENEDTNDSTESTNCLPNGKVNGGRSQTSSSEDSSSSFSDNEAGSRTGTSVEESASESQSSQMKKNSDPITVDSRSSSLFERKSEELDSAVKSISYETVDQVELVGEDDVNMLPNCLNDNEIESAVDSIL
ncbi:unnamed protein product [Callosobruchus maculatus]|uniref:Uncharacterized protein n=1 Tax=Callosobruchus maculatus TaxID=64391 RepID=A0A653BZB4_CALMS|nr:unnamed protein product [Callosobruchus maculatus]